MEGKINVHGITINPKDIQQFLLKESVKDDDIKSVRMLISFKTKKTKNETKRIHLSSFLEKQKQIEVSGSSRNTIKELKVSFYKKDEQDKKIPYENLVLTLSKDDQEKLYFMYKNSNSGIPVAQAKKNKQENKNTEIKVTKKVTKLEENKMEKKIDARKIIINLKDIKKFLINKGVWQDAYSIPMIIFLNNKKEVQRRNLRDLLQDREQMEISPSFGGIIQELKVSFNCYDKNNRRISYNELVLTLCKDDKENLYFMCENRNAGIQVIQADKINARKITINLMGIKNFLIREGVNDDIDSIYMLMSFNNKKGMQGEKLSNLLKRQKQIEIYSGFYNTINGLEISFYRLDQNNRQIPYDKLVLTLYEEDQEKLYFMCENKNAEIQVTKEKENQKENENNNKFQVIRAKNRGIEKNINAHRIIISLNDIKTFLRTEGGLDDIDSIYVGVLINEKTAFSRKIGTMPKSRQEIRIKSNEGKPIDKLALVFYRLSENREIIKYGRLVLILHKDENEQLYFMCENSKAKIKVIQVENRDMDKRINARKITINLEDIRNFLTQERGLNDIDPVLMLISLIQKRGTRKKLSYLLKSQKQIEISCDSGDIIKELEMSFYRKDEKGNRIPYEKSVLILYKDENKKLYFMYGNKNANIQVTKVEEDKKENQNNENKNFNKSAKENRFTFGEHIFFGRNIKHLVHAIFKKNPDFIDFNDAQSEFQYLFACKSSGKWEMTERKSFLLNDFYSHYIIDFKNVNNVKIDQLMMFIRHNNQNNIVKDLEIQCSYMDTKDIGKLTKTGHFVIQVKKHTDETGFKYTLVDRDGDIISHAVDDDDKEEVENLTDYLSDIYKDSNGKKFIERFNLAADKRDVVLKDTAKGIILTDKNCRGMSCVCLGTDTKLTFTDLFIDAIKGDEKFSNKFYVLTKSQALKHIASFILLIQRLPFESLSFIDQKIVQSYDTKKSIGENLNGKDMVTLHIENFAIDPNLQINELNDDLTKLCQIDDGYKCAVAWIKLLSKIQAPNSNFKYQLNSVKDGKSILETRDIFKPDVSKTLVQAQNNTEEKTSWLEAKKDPAQQAYEAQQTEFSKTKQIKDQKNKQDTDKNLKIQIKVADVKKFLSNNGLGQQDFKEIYIKTVYGKLINDKNGEAIKKINIGDLADSSYINVECYGNDCMLMFGTKEKLKKSQMKQLTLKLQQDGSGFSLYYCLGKKNGINTEIKIQKVQKFNISNETEDKKESLKSKVNQITPMAKKINVHGIKIDLDDIRIFLTTQGILNDIKSINMEVQINQGESYAVPISNMHKDRKYLVSQSLIGNIIDELEVSFFEGDKDDKEIQHKNLGLTLYKDENKKLYFMCGNRPVKIKVTPAEENKKENKNNENKQDTDKDLKIQIKGADVKKFLEDNKASQQDFQNIYIMSSIGTLIKDKNGKRIEEINIGNLEDPSCINIECYGDTYMLVFFQKYGQDTRQMKELTLKLQKDDNADSGFSIFYAIGEKRGQKTDIKVQKVQKFNISTENKNNEIKVTQLEVDKKENKNNKNENVNKSARENRFTFGKQIFFGPKINYLVYAIFKKKQDFIDLYDAQCQFQYFFRYTSGDVVNNTPVKSVSLYDSAKDVVFQTDENLTVNRLKLCIRHNNNNNLVKDEEHDLYKLLSLRSFERSVRERGYLEFEVKKYKDENGFEYQVIGQDGNIIFYAVAYDDKEAVENLTKRISNICEDSEYKKFIERFSIERFNSGKRDVVLKDKVEGIYLTSKNSSDMRYLCLGKDTKLTFTDTKFIFTGSCFDNIQRYVRSNNKFYVLLKSQALKDIVDFILQNKYLPFESLSFINQEIVKSYDIEKGIQSNLDGKDMTTLCIDDFEIDLKLKSNKFSDDLDKLCQIDNGFQCAVALIELLSKIKDPNSNFKYELNNVKDGKLMLKANNIFEILEQAQNNTETQTSWLEAKKAQALKSQPQSSENINSSDKPFSEL